MHSVLLRLRLRSIERELRRDPSLIEAFDHAPWPGAWHRRDARPTAWLAVVGAVLVGEVALAASSGAGGSPSPPCAAETQAVSQHALGAIPYVRACRQQ